MIRRKKARPVVWRRNKRIPVHPKVEDAYRQIREAEVALIRALREAYPEGARLGIEMSGCVVLWTIYPEDSPYWIRPFDLAADVHLVYDPSFTGVLLEPASGHA